MSDAEELNNSDVRATVARTLCWKCRDGRTRAHHRLCSKRGGKAQRLMAAWTAEILASKRQERSPGRLRGIMRSLAQDFGRHMRRHEAEVERLRREMSPLTASPKGLREIAMMLGVA